MAPAAGHSLTEILSRDTRNDTPSRPVLLRDHVLLGKERNDVGRPHDGGYPTRGIVTEEWFYIQNFEPARWPAGNPETGYMDCDSGKTQNALNRKTFKHVYVSCSEDCPEIFVFLGHGNTQAIV